MTVYTISLVLVAVLFALVHFTICPTDNKKQKIVTTIAYIAVMLGVAIKLGELVTAWDNIKGGLIWISLYFVIDFITSACFRART